MNRRKQTRNKNLLENELDKLFTDNEPKEDYDEPAEWTIITAMNRVLELARGSKLSKRFWETSLNPLSFLTLTLGLTDIQVVFIAIMVESGEPITWRGFSNFLSATRLSMMVYTDEVEDLLNKRWICRRYTREMRGQFEGFALAEGVVNALRHNRPFEPEKIAGLQIQQLIDKLESRLEHTLRSYNADFEDDERWMVQLCQANPHLPLCHEVLGFKGDLHVQSLLMLIVFDYAQWADSDDEGLTLSTIDSLYPEDYEANDMRRHLRNGSHMLIRRGYIEHTCVDGIANVERYSLTRRCKEELLRAIAPASPSLRCPIKSTATSRAIPSSSPSTCITMPTNRGR